MGINDGKKKDIRPLGEQFKDAFREEIEQSHTVDEHKEIAEKYFNMLPFHIGPDIVKHTAGMLSASIKGYLIACGHDDPVIHAYATSVVLRTLITLEMYFAEGRKHG